MDGERRTVGFKVAYNLGRLEFATIGDGPWIDNSPFFRQCSCVDIFVCRKEVDLSKMEPTLIVSSLILAIRPFKWAHFRRRRIEAGM